MARLESSLIELAFIALMTRALKMFCTLSGAIDVSYSHVGRSTILLVKLARSLINSVKLDVGES